MCRLQCYFGGYSRGILILQEGWGGIILVLSMPYINTNIHNALFSCSPSRMCEGLTLIHADIQKTRTHTYVYMNICI